MSFLTQADMADDGELRRRVTACAALEGITNPEAWAYERRWQLSAQPDWDDAYSYAVTQGHEQPGRDSAVISDAQILSAVQALRSIPPTPAV